MGPEKIWKRQKELTDFAATTITEKTGWKCMSRFATEDLESPLLAFQVPQSLGSRGFELLRYLQNEKHLVISNVLIQNEWCLRISPNIYNTEEEIDRAADILATLK